MAKTKTKEELLELISSLSFDDQVALHKSLTEEIETEAKKKN